MKRGGRWLASALLDLLAPACCPGCGARLSTPHLPVCGACRRHLPRVSLDEVRDRLDRLPAARGVFEGAFSLWRFDRGGRLQRIQHTIKYGNRPFLARALGQFMGHALPRSGLVLPPGILVLPVPLHRTRYLERGYNQSAELALGVAAALRVPCRTDLLRRSRATRSQTRLNRTDRWANVDGAFTLVDAEAVAGRPLLLVDDVLTTGATVAAAAQCLREAPGTTLFLATLALA